MKVSLLDYGAGNVRSVRNAILAAGYTVDDISSPEEILNSECIIFPGVGSYGSAMTVLKERGYDEALRTYLKDCDRPFLGICLGMQTLFESSEEFLGHDGDATKKTIEGLGVIPGKVIRFDDDAVPAVPHIGWNGRIPHQSSPVLSTSEEKDEVYFVHSYYVPIIEENNDWILTSTTYGNQRYVSSVQKGCVVATQFHPEKSGTTGLNIFKNFLQAAEKGTLSNTSSLPIDPSSQTSLVKRVVVALDVRSNDQGDLVVTKGDQYDVRENERREGLSSGARGGVRNLGKPVSLAKRYYDEGADEIAFLNITSFRQGVIDDLPMLQVLEESSKSIFVPLTVGGGIRSYTDSEHGVTYSALEVASRYFRAGADKVSIGSDSVHAAENYIQSGGTKTGTTSIETISQRYGVQAVVVSIDPKRVYAKTKEEISDLSENHVIVELDSSNGDQLGPNGETICWYQCTVKGGREARNICAVTVAKAVEALGAGEIMLNCIDMDGQCNGFDHALMRAVSDAIKIPVIASSGAGKEAHFTDVFTKTNVQAALAAGMFHRKEVEIDAVKKHVEDSGIPVRRAH
mmetsp:Transcript_38906/g.58446  ORF Transcript_38906/g.58446 Transcript_38906/m.58446 type:complete len:572 (-) Transcript_38906:380-2095(-)